MRSRARMIVLAAAGLIGLGGAAEAANDAAIPAETYRRLAADLVAHHVEPRYEALERTAAAFSAEAGSFCARRDPAALDRVRARYNDAADAWMAVQHVRFGPVELFMRSFRLYFWPEARGNVATAIEELVTAGDRQALAPDRFRNASVAVQGLPAAEHLLFVETKELMADGEAAAFRCALLRAIADNVAQMARGIVEGWGDDRKGFAATVANPGPDNPYFRTQQEVALALFKSLHGGLRMIADQRLKPVIGASIRDARPDLAEARPSGRSLRNILIGLEAAQAMYAGEGGTGFGDVVRGRPGGADLDSLMRRAFRQTIETGRSLGVPLDRAVADPALRPRVEKLNKEVLALKQIVRSRLADALGLSVGFNALDGD